MKKFGKTTYHFKFFKGCLPQILLGSFLNTLTIYTHQIFGINDFKGHILKQPCHSGGFSAVVERIRLLEPILRTKYSKKYDLIQLSGFSRSGERNWGKFPFFKQ